MSRIAALVVVLSGFLPGIERSSEAGFTTVLDQIGPNPSFIQGQNAFVSQRFEAPNNSFNSAVIDNFSITSPGTTLTEIDAAVLGFGGFAGGDLKNITAVHVEIYSSIAAAASSLTGDVADINVAAADINVKAPYGNDKFSALAQLGVNVTLGVGTYYLAVIPTLNFNDTGAEIGVYASTFGGDSNAFQVNPGGGFGFTGNQLALGVNAAYRILAQSAAVPEPSSLAMCGIAGVAGLVAARRRILAA